MEKTKLALKDNIKMYIENEYFFDKYIPEKQQETIENVSTELAENLMENEMFWSCIKDFYEDYLKENDELQEAIANLETETANDFKEEK